MMASSLHFKLVLALLLISTACCKSEQDAVDIITKAMSCLDDQYVYSTCQESYRLKAQGSIDVPPQAVDEYCGGPCLRETKLVLQCLHNILNNFRFYNGATLRDVRHTLDRGCGRGRERGDFNVLEKINDPGFYEGDCYDYDHGNKPTLSTCLLGYHSREIEWKGEFSKKKKKMQGPCCNFNLHKVRQLTFWMNLLMAQESKLGKQQERSRTPHEKISLTLVF